MARLDALFSANEAWASAHTAQEPQFFENLAKGQSPDYLWIGCADSRVPATDLCGLKPGSMFVHRNIANVVPHTDFNALSVIQYAVQVLKVKHVIVCGHYGCGGVQAAMGRAQYGLIDNWLRQIQDVAHQFKDEADEISDENEKLRFMCEKNAQAQAASVCYTTIVQDAWARGQDLTVHAWIFDLGDGRLKDLDFSVSSNKQLPEVYQMDS